MGAVQRERDQGGQPILVDVSESLDAGDRVGVVGPNGIGKSTLLRILAGQLPADDGDVDIGTFAYMPQDVGVAPDSGRTVRVAGP